MKFKNDQHRQAFAGFLDLMRSQDCYHRAVAYLLALDETVGSHASDVFDFADDSIKFDTALHHGWQTGTSRKTTRLLMNLWNGWCREDDAEDAPASPYFAVDEIFCCEYAPFYWEAIRLRYPEYCG